MKITVDGRAWINKVDLTPAQISTLKSNLTILPKKTSDLGEDPAPVYLYVEDVRRIGIPRSYFMERKQDRHDVVLDTTRGDLDNWAGPLEFSGTLRSEQQEILEVVTSKLEGGLLGGLIRASPGFGKCMSIHDTYVVTQPKGERILLKDLIGHSPHIHTVRADGSIGTARADKIWHAGEKECYELTLNSGARLVASFDHPVLTQQGWTRLGDIVAGDTYLVATPRVTPGPEHTIVLFDGEVVSKAETVEETIPPEIFRLSDRQLLLFLKTYIAEKGAVFVSEETFGLEINSLSESIAFALIDLLKRLGIRCSVTTSKGVGYNQLQTYILSIIDNPSFLTLVNIENLPSDIKSRSYVLNLEKPPHREVVPVGYNELAKIRRACPNLGQEEWRKLARLDGRWIRADEFNELVKVTEYDGEYAALNGSHIVWESVRSNKKVGLREVGDLTVSETGNVIANGIVSHNTVVSCSIIAEMKVPTLVVVHKEFLRDQWIERMEQFLPGVQVGLAQGDVCDYAGKHVVIGMVHSLSKPNRYPEDFYRWPGLVITDEVHRVGARTWAPVPALFPARYRIGVTATPRRKDGTDNVFYYHLGRILFAAKEQRMVPRVRRVWSNFKFVHTDNFNPNVISRSILVNIQCKSRARNRLIVDQLVKAARADRKILVLSERLGHLSDLEALFLKETGDAHTTGYYVGGMSKKDRLEASTKDVIFATIQYACVDANTAIVDPITGKSFTLKDPKFGRVITGSGSCEIVYPEGGGVSGVKRCLELELVGGKKIVVSEDHKVWTQRGWVEAKELRSGDVGLETDYLTSPRSVSFPLKHSDLTNDDAWLLGAMIGDGTLSTYKKGTFQLTSVDSEIVDYAKMVLNRHGMDIKSTENPIKFRVTGTGKQGRGVKTWLRSKVEEYDLGHTARYKVFPEQIVAGSLSVVRGALAGMLDTDGRVTKLRGEVGFSSSSRALLEQIRTMLLRLGIPVIHKLRPGSDGCMCLRVPECYSEYLLSEIQPRLGRKRMLPPRKRTEISSVTSVPPVFVAQLKEGLRRKGAAYKDVYDFIQRRGLSGGGIVSSRRELSLQAYELVCKEYEVSSDFDASLVWRRLTAVREVGLREVGDLSVPPLKSWVFGGVIVHNSEGMDIPPLDTLFITSPQSDVEQSVGRILRPHPGKKEPIVVDFRDDRVSKFKRSGAARDRFYKRLGVKD